MRKFLVKIGLVLIAAAGLFIWFQGDASVLAGAHPLGMDDSSGWLAANSHNPVVMDTLEAANTGVLRIEIPWSMVEKSPGAFSWQFESENGTVNLVQLFSRLQRRGIEPVAVLSGGPIYLSHLYPQQPIYREQLLESLERFAGAAADQFGSDVRYWQIGTAINDAEAWGMVQFPLADAPLAEPDPVLYSEMLQRAYHAIKQKDSSATILLGDLVFSAHCANHPNEFLQIIAEQDAWYAFDVVNLSVPQMASAPESAAVDSCGVIPQQLSGIPAADSIQATVELINEIGLKPLWIHDLHFSASFLESEAAARGTIPEVAASDMLARASGLLRAYGGVARVFWRFDPLGNTPGLLALQTYANLSRTLTGRYDGSGLPESRDAFALRFRGNGKVSMLAWYAQGRDDASAITISRLEGYEVTAFSADSDSLKTRDGIALPVDDGGNVALMVSERPVLISGRPSDIKQTITQTFEDSVAQARAGMKAKANNWMQAQKAKAAVKVSDWVEEQQASLLNSLRISLEAWLRKSLGLV